MANLMWQIGFLFPISRLICEDLDNWKKLPIWLTQTVGKENPVFLFAKGSGQSLDSSQRWRMPSVMLWTPQFVFNLMPWARVKWETINIMTLWLSNFSSAVSFYLHEMEKKKQKQVLKLQNFKSVTTWHYVTDLYLYQSKQILYQGIYWYFIKVAFMNKISCGSVKSLRYKTFH